MKRFVYVLALIVKLNCVFAQSYNLRGNATTTGPDCYRLTQDSYNQVGAVWYTDNLNLNEHFDIEFLMNFGTNDSYGADGMVFIMQTIGNNELGNNAGELGFSGFGTKEIGVEFDTFQNNSSQYRYYGDPIYDHVAVVSKGSVNHNDASSLFPPVQASASSENIEDGKDHLVRITWEPSTKTLEVFFDCERRISLVKDIINEIFDGKGNVWWGFSGATGAATNNQTVCLAKQILFKQNYTVCAGQSTKLVSRIAVDNQYTWSPSTGLDNPRSQSPKASPTKSTTYVVTYKNYCGKTVNDTVRVEVPLSSFTLGKDTTICSGSVLTLKPPVIAGAIYKWQDNSTGSDYTVTSAGSYDVQVMLDGCTVQSSIKVAYKSTLDVELKKDTVLCPGSTLSLNPNIPGATYRWQDGSNTPVKTVTVAGVYSVTATANGCIGSATIQVTYASVIQQSLGEDRTLCPGQSVTLNINQAGATVLWDDNSTSVTRTVTKPGLFWVSIKANGCTTRDSVLITSKPNFTFSLDNDQSLCSSDTLMLSLPVSPPAETTFHWSDGSNGNLFSVTREGMVWLESNLKGCLFRDSISVNYLSCSRAEVYIPDAFSPNGDGQNDELKPLFSHDATISGFQLIIYSRWGEIIFASSDQKRGWDGSALSGQASTGVYAYQIIYTYDLKNERKQVAKSGSVTLIR